MSHEVIVIGGGHNGLTCAALLAKAGRSVRVVERREIVGGLCAGETFHPGYRHHGLMHDTTGLRPAVVDALDLERHGLQFEAGRPDPLGGELSGRDAERFADYRAFVARVRRVLEPLLNRPPLDLPGDLAGLLRHGLAARRLGRRDMMELMRIPPMCVADWLREWFDDERLNAELAWPAILGTWCGPWSGGTAANLLLYESVAHRPARGGPAAVATALERAAAAHGVEIRTGAEVARITVSPAGAVSGVELDGGECIAARHVVASCDPKTTFLRLLAPRLLTHRFEQRIRAYRMRGTTAKVHLALNRASGLAERACTGQTLDDLERAFDPVKYRQMPERPILDVRVPPDCAPEGHAVLSILAHFVPYELDGGWTDEARERLGDVVVAELERNIPGIGRAIVAREVLTPADIEARYGVHGGQVHHGEPGLDQLLARPAPECARYGSPIEGLFLCGGGTHPGGGITGCNGLLAARAVLSA